MGELIKADIIWPAVGFPPINLLNVPRQEKEDMKVEMTDQLFQAIGNVSDWAESRMKGVMTLEQYREEGDIGDRLREEIERVCNHLAMIENWLERIGEKNA